jgi:formylglycine-generating enzyme required for sulfatase activity
VTCGAAAAHTEVAQAGQTFRDCAECPEMVVVPKGAFLMGSSAAKTARDLEFVVPDSERAYVRSYVAAEHPQHSVSIDRPFALGIHHVTRSEFAAFVRETGYLISGPCTLWADHRYVERQDAGWRNPGIPQTDLDPVVCVSWQDAKAYIAWLNDKVHDGVPKMGDGPYRLPSEAEWEYAARANTQTARWWGDSIGLNNANCDGCGSRWDKRQTAPVGSFPPNPFGLYDMLGDSWELIEDCWNATYIGAPSNGGAWTSGNCDQRVMRGGSWTNPPWILRSAHRSRTDANVRRNYIGFRLARESP